MYEQVERKANFFCFSETQPEFGAPGMDDLIGHLFDYQMPGRSLA